MVVIGMLSRVSRILEKQEQDRETERGIENAW